MRAGEDENNQFVIKKKNVIIHCYRELLYLEKIFFLI